MLQPGDDAPDFRARDQSGVERDLGSLCARKHLALYFYPKDFTLICTREACAFRDAHEELRELDVRVAGVSSDTEETHANFAAEHGLPFPLIADPERKIARAYESVGLLGLPQRVTYLISPERKIVLAFRAELSGQKHVDAVRRALAR